MGVPKPANTPLSTEVLLRHQCSDKTKDGCSGLFSGLGTYVVRNDDVMGALLKWKPDNHGPAYCSSLNGPDLFTELPFLWSSLLKPSFTECLPLSQRMKTLY